MDYPYSEDQRDQLQREQDALIAAANAKRAAKRAAAPPRRSLSVFRFDGDNEASTTDYIRRKAPATLASRLDDVAFAPDGKTRDSASERRKRKASERADGGRGGGRSLGDAESSDDEGEWHRTCSSAKRRRRFAPDPLEPIVAETAQPVVAAPAPAAAPVPAEATCRSPRLN